VLHPEDFIDALAEGDLAAIREAGVRRGYQGGCVLAAQGQEPDYVILVEYGWLKTLLTTDRGMRALISISGPGALVGEQAVLLKTPHTTSVVALGAGCALFVANDRFSQLLIERPALARCVQLLPPLRNRDTELHLASICADPPEQRLSDCLRRLSQRYAHHREGQFELIIPLTQQDLAEWAGVSRETVERILRSWRRRGLVATHRRRMVILEEKILEPATTSVRVCSSRRGDP
jgi:CRP-like cAMP-binding protein